MLYVDHGRPVPGAFDCLLSRTSARLRRAAYFNVPRGFELLLGPFCAATTRFAATSSAGSRMLFNSAAAPLRQQVADEIDALAVEACGERIPLGDGDGRNGKCAAGLAPGAQTTSTNWDWGADAPVSSSRSRRWETGSSSGSAARTSRRATGVTRR